jgi:GNAT superfamily N-acetyltransferase
LGEKHFIISLALAGAADLDGLVALRVEAMRDSLQRIGRFDPVRAGERLRSGFAPEATRHILAAGERAGFVVVKPQEGGPMGRSLLLDHLYVRPAFQGRGIGARVLAMVFEEADALGLAIHVGALKESDSNRFYLRNGFTEVGTGEWDIYYVRAAATHKPAQGITSTPSRVNLTSPP